MDKQSEEQDPALGRLLESYPGAQVRQLAEDVWFVRRPLGNTTFVLTEDGAVVVDPGLGIEGPPVLAELRKLTQAPVRLIIYTHGHADHVGGTGAFLAEASQRGDAKPEVLAHRRVVDRFDAYQRLVGRQDFINRIQFAVPPDAQAFPRRWYYPTVVYEDRIALKLGSLTFECRYGMGETDDATWVWVPERKLVISGDFLLRGCPNVGNPFKVQRYAREWAQALEEMAALEPEVVVPGSGDVLDGEHGREQMLGTARALNYLEDEVVRRLNEGQWQEQILEEVDLPPDLKNEAYLAPNYGCPRFVVHGIIRRYAGWYDGNPGNLFPATRAEVARDVVGLCGVDALLEQARTLRDEGAVRNVQRALHLVDFVLFAEGDSGPRASEAHSLKAELLQERANVEPSFIARNIFLNGSASEKKASETL